jgi:DNA polymerase III subunit beta
MKLVISRESLLKPLAAVSGVVERRTKTPILGNALITADDQGLELVGTDNEVEVVFRLPHEVLRKGTTTVSARKLFDIVRALPEGSDCHLELDGSHLVLKCGKSRFSLVTLASDEFPRVVDSDAKAQFELPAGVLRGVIERSHFAMAHQDVRYYLNGLLIEVLGARLRAVATDGHRLALTEHMLTTEVTVEALQVIVPRKGVAEILRTLPDSDEPVRVGISSNHIAVAVGAQRLISRLIDARYPDYERVLPKEGGGVLTASRELLRQSFNRIAILSNEKFRGIRLQVGAGSLRVSAQNPELEMAEEELEVSYTGVPLEVGFNVSYLLDAMAAIPSEQVVMELTDVNSSCLIRPEAEGGGRYVVMPMRL